MKKKVLFIIPFIPYPLDSGGNQAFFNMVDFLRHRINVSILLFAVNEAHSQRIEQLKQVWQNVEFHIYYYTDRDRALTQDFAIIDPTEKISPLWLYRWYNKAWASFGRKMKRLKMRAQYDDPETDPVRGVSLLYKSGKQALPDGYLEFVDTVSHQGFDTIQVEFYELLALGYILPKDVETIFVHHELRYIRLENELSLFKHVTLEDRIMLMINRDYERMALAQYKTIITLTEVDRLLLQDLLGRDTTILTSPAVVNTPIETEFHEAKNHRFTFVGSGEHSPNLDAVVWFCNDIVPILKERKFNFQLDVIGKWDIAVINRIHKNHPNIHFVGFIDDLSQYSKRSIALVPIRIGSGMRMKILESIFSKVPFITTAKGVEGISLDHKKECFIADTPQAFAEAMIELSDNIPLQQSLTENALKRLESLYLPTEMLQTRLSIYQA